MLSRSIRLRITPDKLVGVTDADTGAALQLYSGSPCRLLLAFFDRAGALLSGDFTDLLAVEVQLKATAGGMAPPDTAVPLSSASVETFDGTLTPEAWEAGTGAHAVLELTGAQLNRAAGKYWIVIVAHRTGGAEPLTLSAGAVQLKGDGYSPEAGDPPPSVPQYPAPLVLNQALADIAALESAATSEAEARAAEDLLLAEGLAEEAASRAAADALKVDKIAGKGLSANDYTDADKLRLANTSGTNTGDQDISGIAVNAAAIALLDGRVALVESGKAPLASPALTGTPTAPTAAPGTNNTQLANTAFVKAALDALINAAPGALDTLKELADALGDDPNFAATVTAALAAKAPLNSPALTGAPTAPTPAAGDNSTKLATTAFLVAAFNALAGAGTAGEVAVFDASGKPVRGSGVTVSSSGKFAGANELVSGGDLRWIHLRGGVRFGSASTARLRLNGLRAYMNTLNTTQVGLAIRMTNTAAIASQQAVLDNGFTSASQGLGVLRNADDTMLYNGYLKSPGGTPIPLGFNCPSPGPLGSVSWLVVHIDLRGSGDVTMGFLGGVVGSQSSGGGVSFADMINSGGSQEFNLGSKNSGDGFLSNTDITQFAIFDGTALARADVEAYCSTGDVPANATNAIEWLPDAVSPGVKWCAKSYGSAPLADGLPVSAPQSLHPRPQARTARCTAADVSVSAGTEANAGLTAVVGDTVSAAMIAALQPGDAVEWTPDADAPDGIIQTRGVRIPGAGAANLRYRNLTGGSLNTGAITGTLTIHIR